MIDPAQLVETRVLRRRNLRTVGALAALFLLPLLLSFWMYYGADWRPAGHTNHGELLRPPIPLPELTLPAMDGSVTSSHLFTGKWTLVYVGDGRCDESCRRALYVMRQTRLALGNDMTRVSRVFLAAASCCDREFLTREHAGLIVLDASGGKGVTLLREFPVGQRETRVFIIDPFGNLMMRYETGANPKGLLEDLKKLLKLSHIG